MNTRFPLSFLKKTNYNESFSNLPFILKVVTEDRHNQGITFTNKNRILIKIVLINFQNTNLLSIFLSTKHRVSSHFVRISLYEADIEALQLK
jgi:hypothetical protein